MTELKRVLQRSKELHIKRGQEWPCAECCEAAIGYSGISVDPIQMRPSRWVRLVGFLRRGVS